MSTEEVLGLVFGIFAFIGLLIVLVLGWFRKRVAAATTALQEDMERSGERVERGPVGASYRGATAGFPKVAGAGAIALTERRLLFRRLTGDTLEIARKDMAAVREDIWFLRAYRGAHLHLIVQLHNGAEVGFIVPEHEAWKAALSR
jgi:hypothetical protein